MKVEDAPGSSKLDMSLDEIIKLNRSETRNPRSRGASARGRGRYIARTRRIRPLGVNGGRIQTKNAIKNRISNKAVFREKQFFTSHGNQNNRSVAIAVLRRARQTAAAAARAAADAAALIQSNHVNRQRTFNQRRGIQLSGVAFERRPLRRRNLSKPVNRYRGSYSLNNSSNSSRQLNGRNGNYRRKQRSIEGYYDGAISLRHLRGRFINGLRNNNNGSLTRVNRGQSNINMRRSNLSRSKRSNNAEYLAQARALIRAQNEQTQGYQFQRRNNQPRWRSKNTQRGGGLKYYAQFWENHQ